MLINVGPFAPFFLYSSCHVHNWIQRMPFNRCITVLGFRLTLSTHDFTSLMKNRTQRSPTNCCITVIWVGISFSTAVLTKTKENRLHYSFNFHPCNNWLSFTVFQSLEVYPYHCECAGDNAVAFIVSKVLLLCRFYHFLWWTAYHSFPLFCQTFPLVRTNPKENVNYWLLVLVDARLAADDNADDDIKYFSWWLPNECRSVGVYWMSDD